MSFAGFLQGGFLAVYFLALGLLCLYGLHRYHLVYLRYRYRDRPPLTAPVRDWPTVTVQLPIYNERYVAPRLLEAIRWLDYPRDRLEVQVLDDSTDDTTLRLEPVIARLRAEGWRVTHTCRGNRRGYKAGALAEGLEQADGEFVAIFDADFLPPPDFLRRMLPYFTDANIGMVQARWGFLNGDYSLLTRLQSIFLDAHFLIEHLARHRSGRFFNFNGTAGVWRKSCLIDAGGWMADTLTEDLDISYRAQLRGWHFVFAADVIAPSELPVEMTSFRLQQHRWAKGSIQTARKLLVAVIASPFSWKVKVEAFFHLTNNVAMLLLVFFSVALLPSVLIRQSLGWQMAAWIELPLFVLAAPSAALFYVTAQRAAGVGGWCSLGRVPLLMALGTGMALNAARAVLEGWLGRESEFRRTPKHGIQTGADFPASKVYRGRLDAVTAGELLLSAYFLVAFVFAMAQRLYIPAPFLFIFFSGYAYVSLVSLRQNAGRWRAGRWQLSQDIPAP
ncbi:MAG: glycosyltransferase family 2 protein [Sulfuricaulis sp.]|uniref:cellulose synthase family protein n=1 Tax=Sulfuricaulis sp. TaxID=2003553 RepID=UPI0025DD3B7A|nr:cellulose synthase family protein [Sulfuricaulis sp.]MCR4347761.1 glycosyltransferase family 2 protein [Sulfuricaulis sp.]